MDKPRKPRKVFRSAELRSATTYPRYRSRHFSAAVTRTSSGSRTTLLRLVVRIYRLHEVQPRHAADHTRVDPCCLRRSRRAAMIVPIESRRRLRPSERVAAPSTSNSLTGMLSDETEVTREKGSQRGPSLDEASRTLSARETVWRCEADDTRRAIRRASLVGARLSATPGVVEQRGER